VTNGRDEVKFTNFYGRKLYVAYTRLGPPAPGDGDGGSDGDGDGDAAWEVRGWIDLDPDETEVRANPTGNQWFYYYAEAVDGAVWAGPHVVGVREARFHSRYGQAQLDTDSPSYPAGMRMLDTARYAGVVFM
jgi:Protein of unknown function (DUF1036)